MERVFVLATLQQMDEKRELELQPSWSCVSPES